MNTTLSSDLFIPCASMDLNDAVERMFNDYPEAVIPEFVEPPPLASDSFKSPKGPVKKKKRKLKIILGYALGLNLLNLSSLNTPAHQRVNSQAASRQLSVN